MANPEILITKISLEAVSLPLAKPLRTSIHEIRQVFCLLASIETNLGITGEGYAFCFGETQLRAIAQMTTSISQRFIQRDPHDIEAIWSEVFRANNFYGQAGVAILAMNPTIEGEATTLYLSRLLKPLGVTVTRIARGIPVGSDLEFTDSATISLAIEGRLEM